MTKPVTGLTDFDPGTEGSVADLDQNFDDVTSAINDLNTYSNYVTDIGAANAYAATLAANLTGALTDGLLIQMKVTNTNTGASTFAWNGGSAISILRPNTISIRGGDLVAGSIVQMQYSSALNAWILQTPSTGGGPTLNGPTAAANQTAIDFSVVTSASQIIVNYTGLAANGTDPWLVQLSTNTGVANTGYFSATVEFFSNTSNTANYTTGFGIGLGFSANAPQSGSLTLTVANRTNNAWTVSGSIGAVLGSTVRTVAGWKPLGANAVVGVRLTTRDGTNVFNAGNASILVI